MLFTVNFISRYSGSSTRLLLEAREELKESPVISEATEALSISDRKRDPCDTGVGGTVNPSASRV